MQSLKNMKGYSVIAIGGKVETVEDYYIDPGSWVIRYDPIAPIDRSYETRLNDHYGRNKDWQSS